MSRLPWLFMCYLKNNKIYTGDLVFNQTRGQIPSFPGGLNGKSVM